MQPHIPQQRSSTLAPPAQAVAQNAQLLALAVSQCKSGKLAEAEALCLRILALDARHAEALHLMGVIGYQNNQSEMAVKMLRRAIAADGSNSTYHSNLGKVLHAQGNPGEAVACFRRAVALNPADAESWNNLGVLLRAQGRLEDVAACYQRALALNPLYSDASYNLGNLRLEQKKFDEAEAYYKQVLRLKPDHAQAYYNLGKLCMEMERIDEAAASFERAIACKPDYADAWINLGGVCKSQCRLDESVFCYRRALELRPGDPMIRWNLALPLLLQGNLIDGWKNFEGRCELKEGPRSFPQPRWRGEPLHGARILLHAEQGLGDCLQFLRYIPLVQAAGGVVVLEIPARLRRLAVDLPGVAELVDTGSPLPSFDLHCPLMSLPVAFGTTLKTIPADVPYLTAPEEAVRSAATLPWPAAGLRVGITWAGSPHQANDRYRSLPLAMMEPLFSMEGVHFFSLQMGTGAEQLAGTRASITDLAPVTRDMADTAAQMAHLDLILTVDTAVAHMAGALGRPVWVMLPFEPDWRWMLEREDSPWYPTARLFRQPTAGDWQAVIQTVQCALLGETTRMPPG